MTQIESMLSWFNRRGNEATLRDILQSHEPWSYEFRARLTDAKTRLGITHTCEQRKPRSENLYRIVYPEGNQMRLVA
jgi:hypothetical protein